jgi:hypothetical protein
MPSNIHFICRGQLGVRVLDKASHSYTSSAWLLRPDEAGSIVGGSVYFHETKSQPSYFGGTVQSVEVIDPLEGDEKEPGRQRYVITLKATKDAKGVKWDKRGASYGMAWTSGAIPC